MAIHKDIIERECGPLSNVGRGLRIKNHRPMGYKAPGLAGFCGCRFSPGAVVHHYDLVLSCGKKHDWSPVALATDGENVNEL